MRTSTGRERNVNTREHSCLIRINVDMCTQCLMIPSIKLVETPSVWVWMIAVALKRVAVVSLSCFFVESVCIVVYCSRSFSTCVCIQTYTDFVQLWQVMTTWWVNLSVKCGVHKYRLYFGALTLCDVSEHHLCLAITL